MLRYFIFLALALQVSAQETMIREVFDPKTDTHVEVLALFTKPSSGGFFPVRLKIANNLRNDRAIHLDFKSSINYDGRIQCQSSFDFSAPAGKTITRDLMIPLCGGSTSYGNMATVQASLSGSLGTATNTIRSQDGNGPSVLLSETLFTPNASTLDAESRKKSSGGYGGREFAAKFSPKQLPDDWLAFSGYDSVLMTDTDWSNAAAGARNAIISWMTLGGQLVIYSTSNPSLASLGIPQATSFGSCTIRPIPVDLKLNPTETLNLVSNLNPVKTRNTATTSDFSSGWPLQAHFGSQGFRYTLFIAVLVIFGILVGPINLFVLAKSGQRHRLFFTTPLISLSTSLILIALIIFQDGFGGSGMRRVLMEVRPDAGQNAAFMHQEQISRTGIMTNARFTVDPACLFLPMPIAESRWARFTTNSDSRGSFNLQPGGGKMDANGDWWQSRSEHGHALSAVVATRGRIERGADSKVLVSTFDFPIESLYFLDESNHWFHAESITTGKPFSLTPIDAAKAKSAIAKERTAFSIRNRQLLERAENRPNHFIALTGQAPGINTHPGIRWQETRTVITGPILNKN